MTRMFLVGAGFIAREHASAAFDDLVVPDGVELHVTDSNSAVLADFVRLFPAAVAHADLRSMLALPRQEGDIAVIATPPVTHRELVIEALEAGVHVLCEKPLAMTPAEADEMRAAARRAERILECCDIRFSGLGATQEVRRLVAEGALGTAYHVTFANTARRARTGFDTLAQSGWFRDPAVSGGGVMMDWGPYDIAVLQEVLQPVRVEIVHAWASAPETGGPFAAEATRLDQHVGASMVLEDSSGTRVPVTYERAAATHGVERAIVQIEGSARAVSWDWLDWVGDGAVRVTEDVDGLPSASSRTFALPALGFHARPLARMVELVTTGVDPDEVAADAVFRFDWVRAVLEAAETGAPVEVVRDRSMAAQGAVS